MKETYITGANGVLGHHLTSKLDHFACIPHQDIENFRLRPYERFFFCSTYGNMSWHKEDDKILKANVLDLITILQQSDFSDGVRSFIFVSSSSVKREIQTMYSRTKNAAEQILLAYMEKYKAPICIVRPFSITGVGDQAEHLIPTLIRSCLDGEEMPFVPDAVHDYIDADDVADGIIALSDRHANGIFELGTGHSVTNQEVKDVVEKVTGKKANTHLVSNLRSYDSSEWVCTDFKARQYGWEPKKSLEQSVIEMVENYELTRT